MKRATFITEDRPLLRANFLYSAGSAARMYSITESLQPSMLSRFAGVSDPAKRESGSLQAKSRSREAGEGSLPLQRRLRCADVLDYRIAPAIDVEPVCRRERSRKAGEREPAGEIPIPRSGRGISSATAPAPLRGCTRLPNRSSHRC